MNSGQRFLACSTICLVALTTSAAAAVAGQMPPSDARVPTSIELALAQYSCGFQRSAPTDAHFDCINEAVGRLRATFGYDLTRLSASERNAIDRFCGSLRTANAQDAYVACISGELSALAIKKAGAVLGTEADPAATPTPAAKAVDFPPRRSSSRWAAWLLGLLGLVLVGGGAIWVVMRSRVAQRRCRSCGAIVSTTADLCPDCRKHAAEAVRHLAAERAERERANQDSLRSLEPENEQTRAAGSVEQSVPRAQPEQHQTREQPDEELDARPRQEQTSSSEVEQQPKEDPVVVEEVFDPYAILGVSPGATPDLVLEAYRRARSKYDPATVEFLGADVQSYYREKANVVERAYRMIAGEVASTEAAARG